MTPAKPNWQKILHWLSPLLLVSLVLHGVAMVIPVPDKKEIVEELEVELPGPISVTELPPQIEPEPELVPEPIFVPAPPPPAVVAPPPPEPPPVVQLPPPVVELVELPPEPDLTPEPALPPEPELPPESLSQQLEEQDLLELSGDAANGVVSQSYNAELANTPTFGPESPLYQLTQSFPGVPTKPIRKVLELRFPKADICFEQLDVVPKDFPLSAAVVLEQFDESQPEAIDGGLLAFTGHQAINQWVDQSLLPPLDDDVVDPNALDDAVIIPELADVDIVNWISTNYDKALFEDGEIEKIFTFRVNVTVSNNPC